PTTSTTPAWCWRAIWPWEQSRSRVVTSSRLVRIWSKVCASATVNSPPSLPVMGHVDRVITLTILARALLGLDYADPWRQRSEDALGLAQQTGHPLSLAYA